METWEERLVLLSETCGTGWVSLWLYLIVCALIYTLHEEQIEKEKKAQWLFINVGGIWSEGSSSNWSPCIMKHSCLDGKGLFQDEHFPINRAWGGHWMVWWDWKSLLKSTLSSHHLNWIPIRNLGFYNESFTSIQTQIQWDFGCDSVTEDSVAHNSSSPGSNLCLGYSLCGGFLGSQ